LKRKDDTVELGLFELGGIISQANYGEPFIIDAFIETLASILKTHDVIGDHNEVGAFDPGKRIRKIVIALDKTIVPEDGCYIH